MRPLLTLAVLPMLIGVAAALLARETRTASLIAAALLAGVVFMVTRVGDADAGIGWLAAVLVLPLPIAFALIAVAFLSGRADPHRPGHRPHA